MDIRQLTPAECIQYRGICNTVFFDIDRADIFSLLAKPETAEAPKDNHLRLGAINGQGQVESALVINSFTIRMHGQDVKMGGIGGVVTRPESRSQGLVTQIMKEAFVKMEENGQIFSFLYPFSYQYYRKLGYELCQTHHCVTIPIKELKGYPYPTNITMLTPGDDLTPYKTVYKTFVKHRNLAFVRGDAAWEHFLNRDPYQRLEFTYLLRDDAGQPIAYVLYQAKQGSDDGNRIKVKEIAYTTIEGLHQIFGFFAKLGAEFNHVKWNAPRELNPHALFPGGYEVSISEDAGGMNRIVNVEKALAILTAPAGSGTVVVDVVDQFLPHNTGLYHIRWSGGRLAVEKAPEAQPDISLTVETLAQLVTGYMNIDEARHKLDVKIHGQADALTALFPHHKLHLVEFF